MYHANSGYFFKRNDDGSVEMEYRNPATPEGQLIAGTIFSADTWASIVASVSIHGDNNPHFQNALEFHNGKDE